MGELGQKQVLKFPLILCGIMVGIGLVISQIAGLKIGLLFVTYPAAAIAVSIVASLIWLFIAIAKMARAKTDRPLHHAFLAFRERAGVLTVPSLIFPIFLGGFTAAKCGIPHLVGYHWDRVWADLDKLIFGMDPWIFTHAYMGPAGTNFWAFFYTVIWGSLLAWSASLVALFGSRQFAATFYTAMMLTWLIAGCFLAYAFSSAGPLFVYIFDPTMAERFEGLRMIMMNDLAEGSMMRKTQSYLTAAAELPIAAKGGGISAMPSMHLGACAIYVLAAQGTRWFWPALIFWVIIFIGSVHFGYHYAVDGIVAAGIAMLCWRFAARHFGFEAPRPARPPKAIPAFQRRDAA